MNMAIMIKCYNFEIMIDVSALTEMTIKVFDILNI